MASLMSDIKNPFLKDYSTTSLLKKNFGVLLVQSQVKEDRQNFIYEYKNQLKPQKQNISTSSSISNPFSKKSLNALEMLQQKRDPGDLRNSQVRSLSQNRNVFGSIDKNIFYKGLQDLGRRQMMKREMQKEARYQVKAYGPESLRYQYMAGQYQMRFQQQKFNPYVCSYPSVDQIRQQNDSRKNIQTTRWNTNITSEYYGYRDKKDIKQDDEFVIQKGKSTKRTSIRKSNSDFKRKSKKQTNSQSNNISNIPEDRNQDLQTAHHLKISQFDQPDFIQNSLNRIPQKNLPSIQSGFQPRSSASSGFGCQTDMYESGGNFFSRFGGKKGPLDIKQLDNDEKEEGEEFDLDQFEDIYKKKKMIVDYPEKLEYNNKIYYNIPL